MKGQWFLISAIIASSIFLTISFSLKSFFSVDTSSTALYDEHYYFFGIKSNVNEIKLNSGCSSQNNGLTEKENNLREYLSLTKEKMAEKGYFFYGDVTGDCSSGYNVGLLLASEKFALCENVNSNDIISGLVICS